MFRLYFKGVGVPWVPPCLEGKGGRWTNKVVLNMEDDFGLPFAIYKAEVKLNVRKCPDACANQDTAACQRCVNYSRFKAVE